MEVDSGDGNRGGARTGFGFPFPARLRLGYGYVRLLETGVRDKYRCSTEYNSTRFTLRSIMTKSSKYSCDRLWSAAMSDVAALHSPEISLASPLTPPPQTAAIRCHGRYITTVRVLHYSYQMHDSVLIALLLPTCTFTPPLLLLLLHRRASSPSKLTLS